MKNKKQSEEEFNKKDKQISDKIEFMTMFPENNKYYTPYIEEFHVGFEYEIWDFDKSQWKNGKVKSFESLLECPFGMSIEGYVESRHIRVKHLDREDIEECGWKPITHKRLSMLAEYYLQDLYLNFENNKIYVFDFDYEYGFEYKFQGYLKNKSELRKLMQQHDIKAKTKKS